MEIAKVNEVPKLSKELSKDNQEVYTRMEKLAEGEIIKVVPGKDKVAKNQVTSYKNLTKKFTDRVFKIMVRGEEVYIQRVKPGQKKK